MHMVDLAIEFDQSLLEVSTDAGEDAAQVVQYLDSEDLAPILGHDDQVDVHQEYTLPAVANVVVCITACIVWTIGLADMPRDPTLTRRSPPASKRECPAGSAAHARRRCGPDARRRTQGVGSASEAMYAGPAS